MQDGNKVLCHQCNENQNTTVTKSIVHLPNILILHLHRFDEAYQKNMTIVPIVMELKCFCLGCKDIGNHDDNHAYELYAIIVHSGETKEGGHYYCYIKMENNRWYCCNDSSITCISNINEKLKQDTSYILFYKRNK